MPSSGTTIHPQRAATMLVGMSEPNVLGEFLRARRGRLHPRDVGLPGSLGRRRTPGLRREELASLAGVSVDYYIRLEQGKERNPGVAVLESLGDALRLDADERQHLRALAAVVAGRVPPAEQRPAVRVVPDLDPLLDRLRPWPALVLSRTSDVLAANLEGLALFPGLAAWVPPRRNTLRYVFTHPTARTLFDDWEHTAATGVANLRAWLATDPEGPDLVALHEELRASSADFQRLWDRQDVRPRRGASKVLHHPDVGTVTLTHSTLRLEDDQTRLSLYQPAPASTDDDAVHLLALSQPLEQRS